jgi:hypothetical protein
MLKKLVQWWKCQNIQNPLQQIVIVLILKFSKVVQKQWKISLQISYEFSIVQVQDCVSLPRKSHFQKKFGLCQSL